MESTEKELNISTYLRVVKWGEGSCNDHSLKIIWTIIIEKMHFALK